MPYTYIGCEGFVTSIEEPDGAKVLDFNGNPVNAIDYGDEISGNEYIISCGGDDTDTNDYNAAMKKSRNKMVKKIMTPVITIVFVIFVIIFVIILMRMFNKFQQNVLTGLGRLYSFNSLKIMGIIALISMFIGFSNIKSLSDNSFINVSAWASIGTIFCLLLLMVFEQFKT